MYTFKVADYVFKLLLICFRATKLCARHVNYKSFAERGTWDVNGARMSNPKAFAVHSHTAVCPLLLPGERASVHVHLS